MFSRSRRSPSVSICGERGFSNRDSLTASALGMRIGAARQCGSIVDQNLPRNPLRCARIDASISRNAERRRPGKRRRTLRCREMIASHVQGVLLARDLQHLIYQIRVGLQLVQRLLEKLELHVQIHAGRTI